MTDDEDSLKVYGGTKLLDGSGNGAGPRKRNKNGDNQLIDVNAGINTDSDSDMERQLRKNENSEHSSDEGLVSPKKVSVVPIKAKKPLFLSLSVKNNY